MAIETAVIRQFLRERFDDEELDALCFDYFADVQQDFTLGMTKRQKIQLLLDHCRRQNRLPDLSAALERERPDLYKAQFGAEIVVPKTVVPPQPHPRNPRQIFISHATKDADLAHRLAQDLRRHGWQVWIAPDSIQPGEKWVEAIGRGLEESGVFVLVVTEAAMASRWVKQEANLAIQLETKGKMRFFPLLVEPTDTPLMWQAYQFLPFTADDEESLNSLLARLESKLVQTPTGNFPQNLDRRTKIDKDGTAARQLPSILSRYGLLPLWGMGILLVVVGLVIWSVVIQFYKPTEFDETREPAPTIEAELTEDLWPFIADALPETISVNQTVTGKLASGGEAVDLWVVPEVNGRSRIDIILESEGVGILRLYDSSSQIWEAYVDGGQRSSSTPGSTLQIHNTIFHEDDQYLIAVSDANGQPATYRLSVAQTELMVIGVGDSVEGRLEGQDPDVYIFRDGPATIDIVLEVAPGHVGELFLFDNQDSQLGYVSNPGRKVRLEDVLILVEEDYEIVVWDANRVGGAYTLTVQESEEETAVLPATNTPASTPTPPLPTNTPAPVVVEIPVEIRGEIFEINANYTLDSSSSNITFTFLNSSEKEPVNVIVEKANGGGVTTSGDMDKGDEKIVSTLLSSDLSGVRLKIFRWAPGFLGASGSGGGEAFLTLPTTGDVEISIEVID